MKIKIELNINYETLHVTIILIWHVTIIQIWHGCWL